jgi:hypothetical protein
MSLFPPAPFDRMGEADVREDILAPLVKLLGYRSGTKYDVMREQTLTLRYPKTSLGRKNPAKDIALRGKADYILEVTGHARWILEAKAPGIEIDIDSIEQAWTYANHAEVRAVYFALCNGREFKIFATQTPPSVGALLTVPYEALDKRFAEIDRVLGPVAIKRNFPDQHYPLGRPLGPALRSFARITSGAIAYHRSTTPLPILTEMQITVADGAVERDENGCLIAFLRTQAPFTTIQDLLHGLGLDSFELKSNDTDISLHPDRPTELAYSRAITFPEGAELLDTTNWQKIKLPKPLNCSVTARARGFLESQTFQGNITTRIHYTDTDVPEICLEGKFHIRLT